MLRENEVRDGDVVSSVKEVTGNAVSGVSKLLFMSVTVEWVAIRKVLFEWEARSGRTFRFSKSDFDSVMVMTVESGYKTNRRQLTVLRPMDKYGDTRRW